MFCPWQASLTSLLQVLSKAELNRQFRDSLSQLCDGAFLLLTNQKGERFAVIKEIIKSLHPFLGVGGSISTKDEEKAEILSAFLDSVFCGWTSYAQGTQLSELEERNEEQNEVPIIKEKTVSNLLLHFNARKSMGPY